MFEWLAAGFTQRVVVGGMENNGRWGPTGLAFAPDGSLLIANYHDGHVWRTAPEGGTAEVLAPDLGAVGVLAMPDGSVLATCMAAGDLAAMDPLSGAVLRRYRCPHGGPVGAALDPTSGRVLVTLLREHALAWLDPGDGAWELAYRGAPLDRPDGLDIDAEGNAFVGSVGNDRVVRLGNDGRVSEAAAIGGEPDGIAVAAPGSALRGAVLVSCHDGAMYRLDRDGDGWMTSPFARGGTRGDHMVIGPDGCLYLTQTDEVLRIGPAAFR